MSDNPSATEIDFGYRSVPRDEKAGMVRAVFDSVAPKYDVMNDLMSLGIHRVWKRIFVNDLAPRPHHRLLDLAGGTGDITFGWLNAGGGPAIEAVVANDSQWTMAPIAGRLPHVHGGRLRALAVGSPQRLAALPAVPTIAEAGYAECDVVGWGGIFAPAGTPPATIERLHAAIAAVVARAEVQQIGRAHV